MTSKKRKQSKGTGSIKIEGNVNTGGGNISTGDITQVSVNYSQNLNSTHTQELFRSIYMQIGDKPDLREKNRTEIQNEVRAVEAEVAKREKANTSFLEERLLNIGKMAPDILEVVLTTISNPIIGFAVIAKKVSEKISTNL